MNKFSKVATMVRNLSSDQKEKIVMGSITLGGGIGGMVGLRLGYMRSRHASFGEHLADSLGGLWVGAGCGVGMIALSPITFPMAVGVAAGRYMYPPTPHTVYTYTEHERRPMR
jgi:hypothetical protein